MGLYRALKVSFTFFNIYLNEALRRWRKSCEGMGVPIGEDTRMYRLYFADEQVVITQGKQDLKFTVEIQKYICMKTFLTKKRDYRVGTSF